MRYHPTTTTTTSWTGTGRSYRWGERDYYCYIVSLERHATFARGNFTRYITSDLSAKRIEEEGRNGWSFYPLEKKSGTSLVWKRGRGTCFFTPLLFPHSLVFKLRFQRTITRCPTDSWCLLSFGLDFIEIVTTNDELLVSSRSSGFFHFLLASSFASWKRVYTPCKRGNKLKEVKDDYIDRKKN